MVDDHLGLGKNTVSDVICAYFSALGWDGHRTKRLVCLRFEPQCGDSKPVRAK